MNFFYLNSVVFKSKLDEQQTAKMNRILAIKKDSLNQCNNTEEILLTQIFLKTYQEIFDKFESVLKITMQYYIKPGYTFPEDNTKRKQLRLLLAQLIFAYIKNESQSLAETTKEIFKNINQVIFVPIEQVINSIVKQQEKIKEFKESTIRQKS